MLLRSQIWDECLLLIKLGFESNTTGWARPGDLLKMNMRQIKVGLEFSLCLNDILKIECVIYLDVCLCQIWVKMGKCFIMEILKIKYGSNMAVRAVLPGLPENLICNGDVSM